MYDIPALPVGGHGPGDSFLCFGNRPLKNRPDFSESRLNRLILRRNILVNILRLHTVMVLILSAELSAAFRTFPCHGFFSIYCRAFLTPGVLLLCLLKHTADETLPQDLSGPNIRCLRHKLLIHPAPCRQTRKQNGNEDGHL